MPLYDFFCDQCQISFELRMKIDDNFLPFCPRCQGKTRKIQTGCNVASMKGNDSDIEKTVNTHNAKFQNSKKRVQTALSGLSPREEDVVIGAGGCVYEQRRELEERYGKIFDGDMPACSEHSCKHAHK